MKVNNASVQNRAWLINDAFMRLKDVFDHCSGDDVDQKKSKVLIDNFNRTYKKMTLVEQGEVHAAFCDFLRQSDHVV